MAGKGSVDTDRNADQNDQLRRKHGINFAREGTVLYKPHDQASAACSRQRQRSGFELRQLSKDHRRVGRECGKQKRPNQHCTGQGGTSTDMKMKRDVG